MWSREFQILDTTVHLEVQRGLAADALNQLTSTYAAAPRAADLHYLVRSEPASTIHRDGVLLCTVEAPEDLSPVLEFELYAQALGRCGEGWALHAAALVTPLGAVLLAGPSGAGKSTLARALVERGAGYLTDEVAVLDQAARVRGVTRPISLRGQLFAPPAAQLCHAPQPLAGLLLLRHDPSVQPGLCVLSAGAALCELWACTLRPVPAALELALQLVQRRAVHLITTRAVTESCVMLEQLIASRD